MKNIPTEIEIKSLRFALRGEELWLTQLRDQIPFLRIKDRMFFPTGFVTKFERVDGGAPVEMVSDKKFMDGYPPSVNAEMSENPGALVTFVVWVGDDGYVSELDVSSLSGLGLPGIDVDGYRRFQDDAGRFISDD